MFEATLLIIGLLCLQFKTTRLTGILGLSLLFLVHPVLFAVSLVLGGGGFYVYHRYYKENDQ